VARTWLRIRVDLLEGGGVECDPSVAIWGWGSIPDQYGRRSFDGDEVEEER